MRKQKIQDAAYEVATQVRVVEDRIDSVLAEIADLQGKMIHANMACGTAVGTAQGAFEQLAASVQALVAARGTMGRCHVELAEARKVIPGLRTVAWGDGEECPPPSGVNLRVVA